MTFLGLFVNNLFKHFDLLLKAIQVPLNSQTTNYFQKIYGGESLWWVRPCNIIIWQEKLVLEFCVNFKQCLHEKERMKRKKERKKERMVWEVTGGQHFCCYFEPLWLSKKSVCFSYAVWLCTALVLLFNIYFIWPYQVFLVAAHRILTVASESFSSSMWDPVPWPEIKYRSPALGAWSLGHLNSREVPCTALLKNIYIYVCIVYIYIDYIYIVCSYILKI